ncbi:hypothetical protein D0962_16990 [Leptolyngbyaceae cyanobacterium CCMR0082]|uniref:Uncharacterized protein n=2 Tax=Adonisia turfae TaxID=2950184 RepID=A0A6M0S7L9_9CYAN|nr:hypothetical protein [Adonisia turfae]MDV3347581.1 hypothetical protein [Leptothoe sp. LEGE 181152]NEZ57250.1 hypothetical protein [Adonisia turfae CCMR0081]NEZ64464.1 hypothetical protein [Adonisia turfae CCMR0082]
MRVIKLGDRVRILYPKYAAGQTGTVLEQETLEDGSKTGHWLVKVDGERYMILALLPKDMKVLR